VDERQLLTAGEVAAELGVSLRTVRRWIATGRLDAVRVGRAVRVPRSAFMPTQPAAGSAPEAGRHQAARESVESYGSGSARGEASRPRGGSPFGSLSDPEGPWPFTRAMRLQHQRRLLEITDRIRAHSRPPSGPDDTADAILNRIRNEYSRSLLTLSVPVPPPHATFPVASAAQPTRARHGPRSIPASLSSSVSTSADGPDKDGVGGRVVLDASVAVRWILADEPDAARARSLRDALERDRAEVTVPLNFPMEFASALVSATRNGRLQDDGLLTALNSVADVTVDSPDARVFAGTAVAVALETGLRVADAAYLALARRARAVLVTADRELYEAALRAGDAVAWLGDFPE
jgi:excisionase family DNA binding protein